MSTEDDIHAYIHNHHFLFIAFAGHWLYSLDGNADAHLNPNSRRHIQLHRPSNGYFTPGPDHVIKFQFRSRSRI